MNLWNSSILSTIMSKGGKVLRYDVAWFPFKEYDSDLRDLQQDSVKDEGDATLCDV